LRVFSVATIDKKINKTGGRVLGTRAQQAARARKAAQRKAGHSHLTGLEVGKLIAATKGSRNEARDRCLLLLMFRHGLRVSEACRPRLNQVDMQGRVLHIMRLKHGLSTMQPLRSDELKAISAWLKQRARMKPTGKTFFVSEQRKPLHRSTVNLLLNTCSKAAALPFSVHPQMLRHACGFALADQGADTKLIQDDLGHQNIQYTVRYTAARPAPGSSSCGGKPMNSRGSMMAARWFTASRKVMDAVPRPDEFAPPG
jgi:type 1 fimbriae regulatory protein FimB